MAKRVMRLFLRSYRVYATAEDAKTREDEVCLMGG